MKLIDVLFSHTQDYIRKRAHLKFSVEILINYNKNIDRLNDMLIS